MRFVTHALGAVLSILIATTANAGTTDSFVIGLEETVSDGVPGPGAGNIEAAGNVDVYELTVGAGTLVFFEELSGSCSISWDCADPARAEVFSDSGFCLTDPGLHTLVDGGTYTITVTGDGAATGTYSFIVWEVNPDDVFAITLKQTVSDGEPGPGAGNIEEAGTRDIYTFNVAAGTIVYFEELSGSCSIEWECTDSAMDTVFSDSGFCITDPGTRTLTLGGEYTLTVTGVGAGTGTYSFIIWEVNATDMFAIGLEEIVSDGVPGVGAGNIEEAGTMDVYEFSVAPGTVVFFDELSGPCNIDWECTDSSFDTVFSDTGFCITDPGTRTLELGGTYTITVTGSGAGTGTYSFIIWEVNPTDVFAIGLEETVSDGVPGAGAGNIEEAGTLDQYTFTAAAGTNVFFDELSGPCDIDWECRDSNDTVIFDDTGMCITDPGTKMLTLGGTYTITVSGSGDGTGTYSFILWDVEPPDAFAISLDEVVSDGFPGEGAGNIEEPGQLDTYTFEVASLADVCFEELEGPCDIDWTCVDPTDDEVFDDTGMCITNPGRFDLAVPGTYTVTVSGSGDGTGTYSFVVNTAKVTDFDGNCHVDVSDLLVLLAAWGTPDADVTGDDDTGVPDLLVLLSEWG